MKRFILLAAILILNSEAYALGDITITNTDKIAHCYQISIKDCYNGPCGPQDCTPKKTGVIKPGESQTISSLKQAGNYPLRKIVENNSQCTWPSECDLQKQCQFLRLPDSELDTMPQCKLTHDWCLIGYHDQGAELKIEVSDGPNCDSFPTYGGNFRYSSNVNNYSLKCDPSPQTYGNFNCHF